MARCFVIQPFDGGPFDKRYEDVFIPAIKSTGLEPYRVDRDPHVTVPIDDIVAGIRGASVCLADISLDNPNIWFELGFALASNKEVIMVCAAERRSTFPFDVQHRAIIRYNTDSVRDFETLQESISARLKAILEKDADMSGISELSPIRPVEGLQQHEVTCLISIAQNLDSSGAEVISSYIRNDMERFGYLPIATNLALASLLKKHMINERNDQDGYSMYYYYKVTQTGLEWLQNNKHRFILHTKEIETTCSTSTDVNQEDDPFADE